MSNSGEILTDAANVVGARERPWKRRMIFIRVDFIFSISPLFVTAHEWAFVMAAQTYL